MIPRFEIPHKACLIQISSLYLLKTLGSIPENSSPTTGKSSYFLPTQKQLNSANIMRKMTKEINLRISRMEKYFQITVMHLFANKLTVR